MITQTSPSPIDDNPTGALLVLCLMLIGFGIMAAMFALRERQLRHDAERDQTKQSHPSTRTKQVQLNPRPPLPVNRARFHRTDADMAAEQKAEKAWKERDARLEEARKQWLKDWEAGDL